MNHRRRPAASAGASPVTELRRRYGLSQQDAADRLGCSVGHLKLLEMQSRRLWATDLAMIERHFARVAGPKPLSRHLRVVAAFPEEAREE